MQYIDQCKAMSFLVFVSMRRTTLISSFLTVYLPTYLLANGRKKRELLGLLPLLLLLLFEIRFNF